MRKKDDLSGVPAAIGMVILALLFLGLTFAIYPGWAAIGNFLAVNLRLTVDAPAWVQALGSILAIVATAIIARRDGLHRAMDDKEKEINNLRKTKYYLHKADIFNSLEFFNSRLVMYEKYCANKYPENVAKYRKLYFFKITKKSLSQLSNSIDSMSEERQEVVLTGDYAHILLPLFEVVRFYKTMFDAAAREAAEFPAEFYDENFNRTFNSDEISRVSRLDSYLGTPFEGVMMHKNLFTEKRNELFKFARFEPL